MLMSTSHAAAEDQADVSGQCSHLGPCWCLKAEGSLCGSCLGPRSVLWEILIHPHTDCEEQGSYSCRGLNDWRHSWQGGTWKASVTAPILTPALPTQKIKKVEFKQETIGENSLKCDKDTEVWLPTADSFWQGCGRTWNWFYLRGRPLCVWPRSSEHGDNTKWTTCTFFFYF